MSPIAALRTNEDVDVLARLRSVCGTRGLEDLGMRLADLADLVKSDMADLEELIAALPRGSSVIEKSAHQLLDLGGKRLRPMCVALASKVGKGFGFDARELAVAVELVHSATLLHDDVVDLGEVRRGATTARMIFGNAASVFAGDWLLIAALKRVRAVAVPDVFERLLDIVEEMIFAESLQLENRGHVRTSRDVYFRVVEGKTASLFRWAMLAGGKAGELDEAGCRALEQFGTHLGVAFQLVDDLLDYTGNQSVTGKELFADLREGKMTYPLIVALERDPSLRSVLADVVNAPPGPLPEALRARLYEAFTHTATITECRALAAKRAEEAVLCLEHLPPGRATDALRTVAQATVHREA